MNKLETLNDMDHLKRSRFAQLQPRHGLKLLYWFAKNFIDFDYHNNITSKYNPERGDFGFHYFENRPDQNGIRLLPHVVHKYYVVGNLNSSGLEELPDYVVNDYTGRQDDSNKDRIIVRVCNSMFFDRVYVTEHAGRTNFNRNATYRISKGLLKTIKNMQLEVFLQLAGYQGGTVYQMVMVAIDHGAVQNPDPRPSIPAASHVHPQKKQESYVVMDNESNNFLNDTTIGRYSDTFTRSGRRNRCCECTIL